VEFDTPLRGFRFEIRGLVTNLERHFDLPR
jgi:hypothetical protein